ncbi:ABC transporter substrate-binding protein [Microbacterium sp. cf332]|uniref:ABC transporter substrate-binding protein n=1 Tax=Microbacterium sp. cf332 TaxID=1761804 RepID=UPI0008815DF4|nr:ABC transporter substrate-binding protein [Microbacterium sp. cf332]SDQ64623.1 peptide/nickel transport system substrate-binding protein [Microbacterium sp. cf332]
MRTRTRTGVVISTIALLTLTGCSAASAPDPAATSDEVAPGFIAVADADAPAGGELVVQVDYDTAEASGLDPQGAATARSWMLEGLVYETLTTIDEDLAVAPGLATSWETPSDTEYVFTLADDAVFSNGRPMTAADVVGSLQRLIDNPVTWTGQLGPVASIEATGDLEVTVTLSEPYTAFLAALANTPAAVLPIAEMEAGEVDITQEMLGTGPLVATAHRQDEQWTFAPNENHPDAADLGFSTLTIDIVGDEATRAAALRDGSADLAILNSTDSASLLSGTADARVATQRNTDLHYLMINSLGGDPALADEDVRFAINSAINRDAINELVFGGATSATGVTPVGLPDSCDPTSLPSAARDLAAAKAAVDAVGGLELNLLVYTDEPVLAQIAQVIQQNLAEIGVDVSIEQLDYATYSGRVYGASSDFDLALSWFAGYADPAMVTTWWNPQLAGFSAVFMSGSPELGELIAAGASTEPGSDRAATFADLCSLADEQSEMVPLVLRPSTIGWNTASLSPTLSADEGYGDFLRRITEFRAG